MIITAVSDNLVEFIFQERRDTNAFKGMSIHQIAAELLLSAEVNGLGVYQNDKGAIFGVITSFPNKETKTLHVANLLIKTNFRHHKRMLLRAMVWTFRQRFLGYTLTATRKSKFVMYNTEKLIQRIEKG